MPNDFQKQLWYKLPLHHIIRLHGHCSFLSFVGRNRKISNLLDSGTLKVRRFFLWLKFADRFNYPLLVAPVAVDSAPPPTKNKHRFGVPENQRRAKSSVLKSITRRSPRTTSPVRDKINNGTAIRFTDSLISRLIHCRSFLLLIKLQRSFALIVVTGYDPSILCSWPSAVPLTLHSCGLELPAIKSFLIEK